jgi:glycogen debranching enzyme
VRETLTLGSTLDDDVTVTVTVELAGDAVPIEVIKEGTPTARRPWGEDPAGDRMDWCLDDLTMRLVASGGTIRLSADRATAILAWSAVVPARGSVAVRWELSIIESAAVVIAAAGRGLSRPARPARPVLDDRLRRWLVRSLQDLDALRMATPEAPEDVFFAAGAPWYLTLFGRDSLWAARMVLPMDLAPARGTLRTLARLPGRQYDATTAEEPGKIMHELRRAAYQLGGMSLPPLYYGTVDATPLWICLLHDTWQAGLDRGQVVELLPALESALDWLTGHDGFLSYFDASGRGLANQGWKDSREAIRFRDGRLPEGPIALCEVQGYAYEAAISGAALLEALDRPGAAASRSWADALRERFRAAFWCGEGADRYPALALDGDGRRVDSLTSNIGHLLGTGLLDTCEEELVARRIAGPELDSGLGLRTMSTRDTGYAPLSYHCGSVWPHDTAIVIHGLHRSGLGRYATGLVEGLLAASVAFDQRLPELWSGEGRPVPYPAACRPQAWSAAAAVVVAEVLDCWGRSTQAGGS